jgi:hypothetical protein
MNGVGRVLLCAVVVACCPVSGIAKSKPREAWRATRVADPITGASTCVVAAYDSVGKMSFSRVGALYPIVENNSKLGLLIGVSTGGKYRIPSGDIVWRVDDKPYRDLKASDNPASGSGSAMVPLYKTGNATADKAVADAMATTLNLTASMTATSTVASGEKAKAMLAEMIGGTGLIYRAASAVSAYGLPSDQTYKVGQFTNEGLKPIPLDVSFRLGLQECGIVLPPPAPPQ